MGCGASVAADEYGPVGSDVGMPGASNQMFSKASLALISTNTRAKVDAKNTFEYLMNEDKQSTSGTLNEKWGLSKSKSSEIRSWTAAEFPKAGDMTVLKDHVSIGDDDNFSVLLATYMPIAAPIVKHKCKAPDPCTVVVCPVVYAVDLYVTVDGESQSDGHICCGDATNDRAASIGRATDKVAKYGQEDAIRSMLEEGPPTGTGTPWATVVSQSFNVENFVHLPLICQGNIDDSTLPESEEYGGALMAKFSQLLASVGPGQHEWTLRIAPRGVIKGGEELICGGKGEHDVDKYYETDSSFKDLIDSSLSGQHTSADVPGLSATFTLTVPEKLCQGGGGERKAPTFISNFSADIDEHCKIAYDVAATGPSRAAVASLLGGSVGKPAHIIIPDSNLAGGITSMNTQGGREGGTRFFATALFLSFAPDDEDSLGAMVKFVCAVRATPMPTIPSGRARARSATRATMRGLPIKNSDSGGHRRDASMWGVDRVED